MLCSVGHMFDTSLVAYGIIIALYRRKGTLFFNGVAGFMAACVCHGLWDYWGIGETAARESATFAHASCRLNCRPVPSPLP
jgi:hypothetical protein